MLIELWDYKNTKFLGYFPMERISRIVSNPFLNPLFMAGRVLYLSQLDQILAHSYYNEREVDVWIKLLSLGFDNQTTGNSMTMV